LSRLLRSSVLLALALAATGCAQTFDATSLGVPVTMASDAGLVPQGTEFKVEATSLWFAWGMIPVSTPNLQKSLASQLVGGRSIANLKIKTGGSLMNLIITVGTLGIFVPRRVTFEGVIVGGPAAPTVANP
jgi:hypothetical protein